MIIIIIINNEKNKLRIFFVFFQAARLLGLGPEKIVLLDNKTKILAKSQNTADLVQVSCSSPTL